MGSGLREAGPAVLHLVDCSLLVPPRTGQDGRARYPMLETLRGYGLERLAEAGEQPAAAGALARYALQVAEEASAGLETSAGELAGEAKALVNLSFATSRTGDAKKALSWARQAQRIDPASIPGWVARLCSYMLTGCLAQAGYVAAAKHSCADVLARARQAGEVSLQADCLAVMADLELRASRIPEAGACLRESLEITTSTGSALTLDYCLVYCGHLCAAAGRWAEAITLWAAHDKYLVDIGVPDEPEEVLRREEPIRKAEQALGAARMHAVEERGAAMSLEIAAEFAIMLIAANLHTPQAPPGTGQLSARERELVTLVAQGRTDAQIAAQLYISVRTVRTHLDRIRDKTSCRRRADLTRLALQAHLV